MGTTIRPRKLVVAGLVIDRDRVLVTQRRADQAMGGFWEFPGGKIEDGESPQVALARELFEEIGVGVEVGRVWDVLFHGYPEFDVLMLVYPCTIIGSATPQAVEVADLAWVAPDGLPAYELLPADEPLVARLVAEGVPPLPGR